MGRGDLGLLTHHSTISATGRQGHLCRPASLYDRTLQAADTTAWQRPAGWRPQVVVIGLGINDFSTALNAGEPWATADTLAADYRCDVGRLRNGGSINLL